MEQIKGERCIELIKEYFPNFSPHWDSYIKKKALQGCANFE
jgi:hypothetical protein